MSYPLKRMRSGALALLAAALVSWCVAPSLKADDTKKDEKSANDGGKPDQAGRRGGVGKGGKKGEEARLEKLLKEHPEADTDKDGKISREEARAWFRDHPPMPDPKRLEELLKKHPEADTNKDGKISAEEFHAFMRTQEPPEGKRLEEFLKKHPEADTNKDGKLSREELRAYRKSHPDEEKPARKRPGKPADSPTPPPEKKTDV
jgi:Ca2+-binding EF-hand superfamily protein